MGFGKGNLVRVIVFGLVGQVMLGVLSVTDLHAQESPVYVKVCEKAKSHPGGLRLDEAGFTVEQDVLANFFVHINNKASSEGASGSVTFTSIYNVKPRRLCNHTLTVSEMLDARDIQPVQNWQVTASAAEKEALNAEMASCEKLREKGSRSLFGPTVRSKYGAASWRPEKNAPLVDGIEFFPDCRNSVGHGFAAFEIADLAKVTIIFRRVFVNGTEVSPK